MLTFLPRVVSLDAHWASDETLWLNRSRHFMLSLQHRDFPGTLQSHHPGVTTMWLGGASLLARYGETLSDALTDEEQVFSSPSNSLPDPLRNLLRSRGSVEK